MNKLKNVDYIFHDIMHSNISIEEGIMQCKDGEEAGDLWRMLIDCGEVDEYRYNQICKKMLDKGLLDKFRVYSKSK